MREYNSIFNNIPPGWYICGGLAVPPEWYNKNKNGSSS